MNGRRRIPVPAVLLLLALATSRAGAQTAGISWNVCGPSEGNLAWACDGNSGYDDLVVWTQPFTRMTNVTGAWTQIVLSAPGGTYPAWWQVGAGACRPGAISLAFDPTPPNGCTSAWNGQATGVINVVTGGSCAPSAVSLGLVATTLPGVTRTFETDRRYDVFRLRVQHAGTTGPGACAGCSEPLCIRTFGVGVGDNRGLGWWMTEYAGARWQGATCVNAPWSCGVSPARTSTWGSIKSLYR